MKIKLWFVILSVFLLFSCHGQTAKTKQSAKFSTPIDLSGLDTSLVAINLPEVDWKSKLSKQEYYVLREKGTERAFSGDLWDSKKSGIYTCAACQLPLFASQTKFESGTGWPSFYQPLKSEFIKEEKDSSFGMVRIEVLCARCGGHLVHVFDDGPEPTGLRYCINSVSLDLVEKKP